MSEQEEPSTSTPIPISDLLPEGYHSGLLTAITVILGFSLTYLRFWGIENPGDWTRGGVIAACVIGAGVILQLISLFMALSLKDKETQHYSSTVRWFFCGISTVIGGVVASIIVAAQP